MSDHPIEAGADAPPRIPGFAIQRRLGRGGMGTVWLATDERTRQPVALKVLSADADDDLQRRFDREALIGRRLRHPDIVTFYDAGQTDDGTTWIAMEYLDGFELTQAMRDPAFGFDDRIQVLIRVALALGYAHANGVIHRDVKPSNIFMTKDGGVRLLDFGIARTGDQQRLTRTNRTMGTPRYMAPEQVLGTGLDGRVDLFALALVGYEMFAGLHPWEAGGRAPALLYLAVLGGPPAPLVETFQRDRFTVPDERIHALAQVLHRALATQPEQRQKSAEELASELEAVHTGAGATTPLGPPQHAPLDPQLVAERRVEWARARAARLVMEAGASPITSIAPAALEQHVDRGANRAWIALVVVFGVGLAVLLGLALEL